MQTFLPYADYGQSAASLDQKRLGKQRVEAYQVLLQLTGINMVDFPTWEPRVGRWNHPAMAMWAGHEVELVEYIKACCDEWTSRGYRDSCRAKSEFVLEIARDDSWSTERPAWIGIEEIHRTHRSNLLRKDPEFYLSRFPEICRSPARTSLSTSGRRLSTSSSLGWRLITLEWWSATSGSLSSSGAWEAPRAKSSPRELTGCGAPV